MLSNVSTLRNTVAALISAVAIAAIPASPAQAWGDREQGFVTGVAAALIIDGILKQSRKAREVRVAPPVYFADPTPVRPAPVVTTSIYRTPSARAFQSYSHVERKAIQRQLRAWGYYRGGIDGAFGPGTYSAVTAFAADEGLTSRLSSVNTAYAVYDGLLY
jgi:hypothetical protein